MPIAQAITPKQHMTERIERAMHWNIFMDKLTQIVEGRK